MDLQDNQQAPTEAPAKIPKKRKSPDANDEPDIPKTRRLNPDLPKIVVEVTVPPGENPEIIQIVGLTEKYVETKKLEPTNEGKFFETLNEFVISFVEF